MARSIIQSNDHLRQKIKERIESLELTLKDISLDAKKYGVNLTLPSISKYLNNSEKNNLSEQQIIWLGYRYGIFTTLHIGIPTVTDDKKIKMYIPAYDEKRCLALINQLFPQGVKKVQKKVKK